MGDHRASIKIEFSMYGGTETADMWINWSVNSGECYEVDQRVIDFFRDAYLKMRDKYDDHIYEGYRDAVLVHPPDGCEEV